jgi:hypothetical protein
MHIPGKKYNPKYNPPLEEDEIDGRFGPIIDEETGEEVFPKMSESSGPATQWESKERNREALMDIGFIRKLIELLRR